MTDTADTGRDELLHALAEVISAAASPESRQAQALLLRRIALEGSVVPSRLPAPRNITELGGYINLLTTYGDLEQRSHLLAAALGLAGPDPLVGWDAPPPALPLVAVANQPDVATGGVPQRVWVRADLADGLRSALASASAAAARLPLWSPPPALPPRLPGVPGADVPDPLLALGRRLWIAPAAALADPTTDPVVVGRTSTDPGAGYRLALHAAPTATGMETADWTGLQWDEVSGVLVDAPLGSIGLLPLAVLLAPSAFVSAGLPARPTSRGDLTWAQITSTAGLLAGVSRLGDELALSYPPAAVTGSVYADRLTWTWNGTVFAPV